MHMVARAAAFLHGISNREHESRKNRGNMPPTGFVKRYLPRFLMTPGTPSAAPGKSRKIPGEFPPDFDETTRQLIRSVWPYTMTSPERLFSLRRSVEYVVKCEIPGAIVECGVWRGGSMMMVARTLLELGVRDRHLYLFDTFEGMSEPTTVDKEYSGKSAKDLLERSDKQSSRVWAYSTLEEVRRAMQDTGYDERNTFFIKGKVEETLPGQAPQNIAILRLDTDWYESTYHELVHLYPRLVPGGVLILDDYGHWEGARRAVDEYISSQNLRLLLNRIDYTGRICVKP